MPCCSQWLCSERCTLNLGAALAMAWWPVPCSVPTLLGLLLCFHGFIIPWFHLSSPSTTLKYFTHLLCVRQCSRCWGVSKEKNYKISVFIEFGLVKQDREISLQTSEFYSICLRIDLVERATGNGVLHGAGRGRVCVQRSPGTQIPWRGQDCVHRAAGRLACPECA